MPDLPKRALGRTGLQVTAMGYGGSHLRGPPEDRPITEDECARLLNAVIDAGINFIDTARAYGISTTMQALGTADARILQALASTSMKPEQLIAFAFQELAGKAEKIGQLNISPDLLRELMTPQPARK